MIFNRSKTNLENDIEGLPQAARRAFDAYPQISASPDFNRRVLLSLEARQMAQKTTFLGRIEAFLGLPIAPFLGSGALGAFFPALVLCALCASSRGEVAAPFQKSNSAPYARFYGPFLTRELLALHAAAV